MCLFDVSFNSTLQNLSQADFENSINNFYEGNWIIKNLMDTILLHPTNPTLMFYVDDGNSEFIPVVDKYGQSMRISNTMWTPDLWARHFPNVEWPTAWEGKDYIIHINTDSLTNLPGQAVDRVLVIPARQNFRHLPYCICRFNFFHKPIKRHFLSLCKDKLIIFCLPIAYLGNKRCKN